MTLQYQRKIADSFSENFEEFPLNTVVSKYNFSRFQQGIYAASMDERWNIFVLDNYLYCAHSFGGACIYKVPIREQGENIVLEKGFVTRDKKVHLVQDIEQEKNNFLDFLRIYLYTDSLDTDPAFKRDIIQQIIAPYQPKNKYTRNIGLQPAWVYQRYYHSMEGVSEDYLENTGWKNFYKNIESLPEEEDIMSLYIMDKETQKGTTYFFDKEGKELIGTIS